MAKNSLIDPDSREHQDEQHNPSKDFYEREFDNIKDNYNEDADSSQEDANIDKQKLSDKEDSVKAPARASAKTTDVAESESEPAGNDFSYSPKKPSKGIARGITRKQGGIAAILVTAIIAMFAGFTALLPFKVKGIMDLVNTGTSRTVETVVDYRAKRVIYTYLLTKGGTLQNGQRAIVSGGPLGSLFATLRANNFEGNLEAKYGIKIENRGGVAHLVKAGNSAAIRTDADIERLIANGQILSKSDIDTIVRKEIPTYRYFKSKKFARWMRIKYGIPRYGLQNSDEKDKNARKADMREQQLKAGNTRVLANLSGFMTCLSGGQCIAYEGPTGMDGRAGSNTNETLETVTAEADDLTTRQADALRTGSNLSSLKDQMTKLVVSKIATKVIPIIGWIDLMATIDHLVYSAEEGNWFTEVPAYFKGSSAGFLFGSWSGYGDQIAAGDMDREYVGVLADQLNGAESAAGYAHLGGNAGGIPIDEEDRINETDLATGDKILDFYTSTPFVSSTAGHIILNAYYETLGGGGLLGWLGDRAGDFFVRFSGFLLGAILPDQAVEWIERNAENMAKLILGWAGVNINMDAVGPQLMNYLHMGGIMSNRTYCEEKLGCRELSEQESIVFEQLIAQEDQERLDSMSAYERWASLDNPRSLATQLAISLPSEGASGGNINTLAHIPAMLLKTPAKLFSAILAPSSASAQMYGNDSYAMYGIKRFGASAEELSQPLSDEVFAEEIECPEHDGTTFNSCMADKTAIESMLESQGIKTETDPVVGGDPTAGGGGGGSLPGGTKQQLAQQILNSGRLTGDARYIGQIQAVANGDESCNINQTVLGLLAYITTKYDVYLSSLNRYCTGVLTASGTSSYHYSGGGGHAFDFAIVNGVASTGGTANDVALLRDILPMLPSGSGIGQSQPLCGRVGDKKLQLPSGIREFSDTCNHLHVEVPIQ